LLPPAAYPAATRAYKAIVLLASPCEGKQEQVRVGAVVEERARTFARGTEAPKRTNSVRLTDAKVRGLP